MCVHHRMQKSRPIPSNIIIEQQDNENLYVEGKKKKGNL